MNSSNIFSSGNNNNSLNVSSSTIAPLQGHGNTTFFGGMRAPTANAGDTSSDWFRRGYSIIGGGAGGVAAPSAATSLHPGRFVLSLLTLSEDPESLLGKVLESVKQGTEAVRRSMVQELPGCYNSLCSSLEILSVAIERQALIRHVASEAAVSLIAAGGAAAAVALAASSALPSSAANLGLDFIFFGKKNYVYRDSLFVRCSSLLMGA